MHLIVSKKHTTPVHVNHAAPPFDRSSVQSIVNSVAAGTLFHVALDDNARDVYIAGKTLQGYTCHIFAYTDSYRTVQTTHNVRIAG